MARVVINVTQVRINDQRQRIGLEGAFHLRDCFLELSHGCQICVRIEVAPLGRAGAQFDSALKFSLGTCPVSFIAGFDRRRCGVCFGKFIVQFEGLQRGPFDSNRCPFPALTSLCFQ